jgi:thioredoxin 1
MTALLPKSFNDLIRTSKSPVLVDFWAEWCGPCKTISPAIQKIAKEYKGRLLTVKINVDQKQQIAAQYQVQSIPTIMMFNRGKIIMRLTGALPYDALKSEVLKQLEKI